MIDAHIDSMKGSEGKKWFYLVRKIQVEQKQVLDESVKTTCQCMKNTYRKYNMYTHLYSPRGHSTNT